MTETLSAKKELDVVKASAAAVDELQRKIDQALAVRARAIVSAQDAGARMADVVDATGLCRQRVSLIAKQSRESVA